MDGFRVWLERAIQVDGCPNSDWTGHCVNYSQFKQQLKDFARRRARIRALMRDSPDGRVAESAVLAALQIDQDCDMTRSTEALHPQQHLQQHQRPSTLRQLQHLPIFPFHRTTKPSFSMMVISSASSCAGTLDPAAAEETASSTFLSSTVHGRTQQQQHQRYATNYAPTVTTAVSSAPYMAMKEEQGHYVPTPRIAIPSRLPLQPDSAPSLNVDHDLESIAGVSSSHSSAASKQHQQSHAAAASTNLRRRSKKNVLRCVSNLERNQVALFLTAELDLAWMYYWATWQDLSRRMENAQPVPEGQYTALPDREDHAGCASSCSTGVGDFQHVAASLAGDILQLQVFCLVNVITTHQILIRYDAFCRALEGGTTPMQSYFLKKSLRHPTSFRKLTQQAELHALAESWLQQAELVCNHPEAAAAIHNFRQQRMLFGDVLASLDQSGSSRGTVNKNINHPHSSIDFQISANNMIHSSSSSTLRSYRQILQESWDAARQGLYTWFLWGLFEDRLGLEPAYLSSRGKSLTAEMEWLATWRHSHQQQQQDWALLPSTSHPLSQPPAAESSLAINKLTETEKQLTGMQIYHLTLNLLSAFLYCMNYYIVEPSSTMYVNRLGAHDAMSGTLIGMMPLAAFMSSIPYSMWTNVSFRHPFLVSTVMLVLGNFIYSFADLYGTVNVALAGRFVCGLGAPKCIIRRYMADTTPVSLRTSVNAGFGMVVAAGSAMGPAMAVVLSQRDECTVTLPEPFASTVIVLNGLTLPGYFMAMLWITFGVVVLLTFEEPDREGLEEQKRLEQRQRAAAELGEPHGSHLTEQSQPFGHPHKMPPRHYGSSRGDDDLNTIFSGESCEYRSVFGAGGNVSVAASQTTSSASRWWRQPLTAAKRYWDLITFPVRLCLGLLFAKVFTIEALVSATSAISKNRYHWQVKQVGTLGFVNGLLVIPFSLLIGRLSMTHTDHSLMKWLVSIGCFGLFLLIDLSDLVATPTRDYNKGHVLAVFPQRYIAGYFLAYMSIQSFEGVIGSTLSKVIPTALASGTFNSGLLATLVDTFGRSCGDMFISFVGFVSLRQLMNLLFIPGFAIMFTCLVVIERYRDMLSV